MSYIIVDSLSLLIVIAFLQIQGKSSERTINAVQRGDPEMGNKLNKFLRACIESHEDNPIKSIHDQGAGGNGE